VDGEVTGDAVAVMGNTTIAHGAKVAGNGVAVLGRLDSKGEIGGEAVSVLGGVSIDGRVRGNAVAVLCDMNLGPNAVIDGDLVVIGGRLTKDPSALVRGDEIRMPYVGDFANVEWLTSWLTRCVFLGRPLGFGPNLGWAWGVAGAFLLLYIVMAVLFAKSIDTCVTTLATRPGYSILASVLTVLMTPVAIALLAITVVGALLIPFLGAGLMFASLFGKAVMLAWIGRRITNLFGEDPRSHPALAVLIGGLIVMLLYTIPFAGFLVFKLLAWLGMGVVVYTIALNMKRDRPAAGSPHAPVAGSAAAPAGPPAAPPVATVSSAPGVAGNPADGPMQVSSSALPRATFFIRLAALLLDLILIAMIVTLLSNLLPRFLQFNNGPGSVLLAIAIYGAIMWKTKGTTIGGIVCGLKVVRLDNREIDWATAWVRALGCFLSLVVAGLGFIWIAIDDEQQSWHDKIAGTVVVRVPKGVSLV